MSKTAQDKTLTVRDMKRFQIAVTRIVRKEYLLTVSAYDRAHARQVMRNMLERRSTRPRTVETAVENVVHHITEDDSEEPNG